MSWFSKTEDYSTKDSGFYDESEITCGSKNDNPDSGSSSTAGAWDDFQHEREYIYELYNVHTR